MLTTKLSRARFELQAHRVWLRSFNLRANASSSFSTTARPQARPDNNKADDFKGKVLRPSDFSRNEKTSRRTPAPKYTQKHQKHQNRRHDHDSELVALQRQLSEAVKEHNFDGAMVAYRSIKDKKLLLPQVLSTLTNSISYYARVPESSQQNNPDPEAGEKLQQYAEELVQDFYKGVLRANPTASGHLLNYFQYTHTWDIGTNFWKWLERQDDEFVGPQTYGAAILLLAAQDVKLEELESLYQQGLARLDVGFAAYHYSPGAIVPDRDASAPILQTANPLLLSIMQARLMRGDAQNAYLALDAATRISPDQVKPLFYTAYQRERPIAEAYTAFAMACRAGTPLPSNIYRSLLSSLRSNADSQDIGRFVLAVRAMLSATYLHIGGGGMLTRNAVTEIVIVLSNILRVKGVVAMPAEEKLRLGQAVQELIRKTVELAARFSAMPTIAAYNSIITNIAGAGEAEATITAAIKEAHFAGLEPNIVTRRSILVAAGSAKDAELVKKGWQWLEEARAREGKQVDTTDLHVLLKACVLADISHTAADAITNAAHIQQWQKDNLLERLDKKLDVPSDIDAPADINVLLAEIAGIKDDLEVFDTRTSDAKGVQDFSDQVVPMLLFPPPRDVRLPEAEMRKLYDQLTTDPSAPPQEKPADTEGQTIATSAVTNVPLGRLRYENWKLITYLLAEAEKHDKAYVDAVDAAIAKGERPPQRNYGGLFEGEEKVSGVGLSDPAPEYEASEQEADVEKARARICELRRVFLNPEQVQEEV